MRIQEPIARMVHYRSRREQLSPRAQTDDELALAGLRREVKAGRPGAANALARHLRGTSRDTTITRRRQAAIDKKALTSVSRSKQIDGPNSPEGWLSARSPG